MRLTTHYSGRYLKLVERNGWEFATRHQPEVVVIVAWTGDGELLLVEQFREPVGKPVIELPAGLVGDLEQHADESLASAASRELLEETGWRASHFSEILRCPTSAGMTDETAVFLQAHDIVREGPGGGDDSEQITVHCIHAETIDEWLAGQYRAGKAIDPKIFSA
ncbi:MAG: NUDIX hydrolase, partial [Wenzhouxiangellaceae bacterium]